MTGLVPHLTINAALNQKIVQSIVPEGSRFTFHLTEGLMAGILQTRDRGQSLELPKALRQNLQRAALWDLSHNIGDPAALNGEIPTTQTGLSFITAYEGQLVLESIVGIDGDVLYRVKRDLLQDESCVTVAAAHNWLVNQMMGTLQSQLEIPAAVAWTLASIPTGITFTIALAHGELEQTFIIHTLTSITIPWLKLRFQVYLQRLAPHLQRWALAQAGNPKSSVRRLVNWGMGYMKDSAEKKNARKKNTRKNNIRRNITQKNAVQSDTARKNKRQHSRLPKFWRLRR